MNYCSFKKKMKENLKKKGRIDTNSYLIFKYTFRQILSHSSVLFFKYLFHFIYLCIRFFVQQNIECSNFIYLTINRNVVKSFYTAGMLFDTMSVFGELNEEVGSMYIICFLYINLWSYLKKVILFLNFLVIIISQ